MTKGNYDNCELSVNVTRPTEADIYKYTAGSQITVKPVKLILHKLPLVPSKSVNVAPPKVVVESTISTLIEGPAPKKVSVKMITKSKLVQRTDVPKCKISGHPSSIRQYTFQVRSHVLKKRVRKLSKVQNQKRYTGI